MSSDDPGEIPIIIGPTIAAHCPTAPTAPTTPSAGATPGTAQSATPGAPATAGTTKSKGSTILVIALVLLAALAVGLIVYYVWSRMRNAGSGGTGSSNDGGPIVKCGKLRCKNSSYCDIEGIRCVCENGFSGNECQYPPPLDAIRYGHKVYLKSLQTITLYPGYSVSTYLKGDDYPTVAPMSSVSSSRQQWIINDSHGRTLDGDVLRYGDRILLRWCHDPTRFLSGAAMLPSTTMGTASPPAVICGEGIVGPQVAPNGDPSRLTPIIVRDLLTEQSTEVVEYGDSILLYNNPNTAPGNLRARIAVCPFDARISDGGDRHHVVVKTREGSSETVWSFAR